MRSRQMVSCRRLLVLAVLACSMSLPVLAAGPGGDPSQPAPPRDGLRDPFWPVDYVRPVQPGEKIEDPNAASRLGEAEWRGAEKLLHESIKGVSRIPARSGGLVYLASVNGGFVGVGDTVSLAANGKIYRWKIASISLRDGPVFERMETAPAVIPQK